MLLAANNNPPLDFGKTGGFVGREGLVKVFALTAAALAAASPASAAWMRAETAHFIVYSDDKEDAVRKLASELETFDAVLRYFHTTAEQDGAKSNKLTVYVVDSVSDVQRLCGKCPNVYGFYKGRAAGSVAFTPRVTRVAAATDLNARTVLQHEYAHHFLFGNYVSAYPAWFSEGYAEFASTFRRDKDGLRVGAPANHRAYGLLSGGRLPAAAMFNPAGQKLTMEQRELLYGRGWLLTHYIMFNEERRAQFSKYLIDLNTGTPSLTAATNAFGKMTDLDRALDGYLNARTMITAVLKPSGFPTPEVTIRALSPGEAAMIDYRLVSTAGVNSKTAKPLFDKAKPVALRFPNDPVAQGWFAEIAHDAHELDDADAAADRAIAGDPKQAQGLLYKGLIGVRRANRDKAGPAAWKAARTYIVRANKLDPNNAEPLVAYYNSFRAEGAEPTKAAIAGLMRAQELAPQDGQLRFMAMAQRVIDGDVEGAKQLLRPLAYNPHAGPDNQAAKLLTALTAIKDPKAARAALEASTGNGAPPDDEGDDTADK